MACNPLLFHAPARPCTAGCKHHYPLTFRWQRAHRSAEQAGSIGVRRRAVAKCAAQSAAAVTEADQRHMQRALDLARRGLGATYPNPAVGCVIVDASGNVVGEGFHPKAGMPHAEVYALRAAGQAAAGATAYVTLEPCNHHGRTPPCSRALVAAGVARVVVGVSDPNPLVGGSGIRTLQAAGIEVAVGCEERACFDINAEFMARMSQQGA